MGRFLEVMEKLLDKPLAVFGIFLVGVVGGVWFVVLTECQ